MRFISAILLSVTATIAQPGYSQDLQSQTPPAHTISVSQLAQEPEHLEKNLAERGVSFQGLFIHDWSEELASSDSPAGFGRDALDLSLTLDAKKALGWKGTSGMLRLKQHISEFGETYPYASQVVSNIDGPSKTTLYELWIQQILFSEKLRVKFGKIDANTEFDQVQSAGDFLNSSMGYSPTILAFPSYPEPKLAAAAFYVPRQNYQLGLGIFKTATNGVLSVAEPGRVWTLPKGDLPGHVSVGYWRLDGSMNSFEGSHVSHTQGVYSVLEQSLWRQPLNGDGNERRLTTFFQFGHADGFICDFTAHLGTGAVLQAPFTSRPHDGIGVALTSVQFSSHNPGMPKRQIESVFESYYKLTVNSHVSLVQDFQLVHRPGGLKSNQDCPILTPRVVIAF